MPANTFLQNFLVRFASFLSIVFLIVGLFLLASRIGSGITANGIELPILTGGAALAILSLIAANMINSKLGKELKNSCEIAAQISEGEHHFNFENTDESELKPLLSEIAAYLSEKREAAERIAAGDFASEIVLRSEHDSLGKAFQNMLEKLRERVQTEEQRELLQKSILKLSEEVSDVAQGDLTGNVEVTSAMTGTIAESFNSMIAELRSLIGQVKDVTHQVGNSANDINYTTEQLARGSETQASQIARTTSAITGMTLQIQEVSNHAALSAQVASDALSNSRDGTKAAQNNIEAMNSIRRQVQETAKRVKKLGERSQEISQTVGLIDDLSDRTSLLALNASLQAAAAGESGRGFALVAEEVERLAERSSRLTQQIAQLARMIQTETKDVVASMEETIHEVVVGSMLADKAGQTLTEIEQVSARLAELSRSISESAKRQADSSEDISQAMTNISKVTEMVNVSSKRAADSVKTLVALSDELRGSVAPFKLPHEKSARRRINRSSEGESAYLN